MRIVLRETDSNSIESAQITEKCISDTILGSFLTDSKSKYLFIYLQQVCLHYVYLKYIIQIH